MKTKLKLRSRRMWANYYQFCPAPHIFDSKARAMSKATDYPATVIVPVAVIPLDDVDSLVRKATDAYFSSLERNTENRWRAALAAIGVLPRQRKGGRK